MILREKNICYKSHTPSYHVIYRGGKGTNTRMEWLVCEDCLKNKPGFSEDKFILDVKSISSSDDFQRENL